MQQVLIIITLFFTSVLLAQDSNKSEKKTLKGITATVVNVLSNNGKVNFALFTKENFREIPIMSASSIINNGISTVEFNNVEAGEYAIICYHDANENGRMDFNENGMPMENYGTSNNPLNFGPPQFESSKFEVADKNLNLEIKF
tara:strand:+ start:7492 stop:7923 length:432 start_codon:yes stop_codon:yes gene_type:complete